MSLRTSRSTPSCKYTRPKTNVCVCRKPHTSAFLRASSPTAPHPEVRQQNGHEEIVLRPHTRTPGRGRRCPPPGLTSQAWFWAQEAKSKRSQGAIVFVRSSNTDATDRWTVLLVNVPVNGGTRRAGVGVRIWCRHDSVSPSWEYRAPHLPSLPVSVRLCFQYKFSRRSGYSITGCVPTLYSAPPWLSYLITRVCALSPHCIFFMNRD